MDTFLVSIIITLVYIVLAPPIITMASEKLNLKAPIYIMYLMEIVGIIFYVIFWVIITVIFDLISIQFDLISIQLDIFGLLIFITVILIPLLTTIPIYLLCKLYYKKEQSREIRLMPKIILFVIMIPLSILIMIINPFCIT